MMAQISIDLQRTFPDNINFNTKSDGDLIKSLEHVLKAFGLKNPEVGYCQVTDIVHECSI